MELLQQVARGIAALLGLLQALLSIAMAASRDYAEDIRQCPVMEPRLAPPKDVSDLRPDDIGVIMALGDSVTAGFGARLISILETKVLQEYRGLSFSIGGDHNAPTVANFIRHYRPDLVGASRGNHFVELCVGGTFCPPDELAYRPFQDVFNAALSGAASGTLGLESKYLLGQITRHRSVDIATDWKMLTVLIGTNEICRSSCERKADGAPGTPADFEQRMTLTIAKLRARLPRLLVNILLLPDVSQVYGFANHHPRCLHALRFLSNICPCAMDHGEAGRWAMRKTTADYNARIIRIAKRMNSLAIKQAKEKGTPRDFAVIVTPVLRDTDLRDDIPAHFASRLDCFHPSATAHRSLAMSVWKDLFVPYSERSTHLLEQGEAYCPSESDRINIHW